MFRAALAVGVAAATPGFDGPRPLNLSAWRDRRVLLVGAHPDDIEFFAGGLVATLRERDLNVTTRNLVLTNGEAGGICYNPLTKKPRPPEYVCEREERAYLRRQEMVAAGAVLGTDTVWRGGFQDGMLVGVHEGAVRERIAAYIRAFKPHIIVTHYPEPNFLAPPTCNGACVGANRGWDDLGYHPDHKSAGRHVLDAAYGSGSAADNNDVFEELEEAGQLPQWHAEELYFFALTRTQPITHYVTLSERARELKVEALLAHHYQYTSRPEASESVSWVGTTIAREVGVDGLVEGFQGFF